MSDFRFKPMNKQPASKWSFSLKKTGSVSPVRVSFGKIFIRPPGESDWQDWSSLRGRSKEFLTPWEPEWGNNALSSTAFRRRLRNYARDWQADKTYSFLIFKADDETLLGGITLSNVRRGIVQSASFGYWIGAPYAAQGYMSDALRAALEFAFTQLELHRMEAACIPSNKASRRVLEKAGFRHEGMACKYLKINGKWQDHETFGLLREEFCEPVKEPPIKG